MDIFIGVLVVLIGLIAGAWAGYVVSGRLYGVIVDIVVGVVGTLVGGWVVLSVFGMVGLLSWPLMFVAGLFIGSLMTGYIGAVIMLQLIRLVAPPGP